MDELKKKYRRLIGTYHNEEDDIKPMSLFVTADEMGYLHEDDSAEYESEFWTGIWQHDLLLGEYVRETFKGGGMFSGSWGHSMYFYKLASEGRTPPKLFSYSAYSNIPYSGECKTYNGKNFVDPHRTDIYKALKLSAHKFAHKNIVPHLLETYDLRKDLSRETREIFDCYFEYKNNIIKKDNRIYPVDLADYDSTKGDM